MLCSSRKCVSKVLVEKKIKPSAATPYLGSRNKIPGTPLVTCENMNEISISATFKPGWDIGHPKNFGHYTVVNNCEARNQLPRPKKQSQVVGRDSTICLP